MNSDYVFIFLVLLIILLFYLAIKHFKFLFFYLWVLLWIFIWIYGKIFIESENFNLGFLDLLVSNIGNFFRDSIIVQFLSNNLIWFFWLLFILLFHRFFYYSSLVLLHFFKWFTTGVLDWIWNRKEKKEYKLEEIEFNKNIWDIKK